MKKLIILFILAVLLPAGVYAASNGSDSPPLTKKEQRRTLRGYKGFVELSGLLDLEHVGSTGTILQLYLEDPCSHIDLLTSHGYQFNNFFYIGGGTGILGYIQYGVLVPFFGNIRINMLNKRIAPVFDFKGGYSVGKYKGGYFSFDLGIRVGLEKKKDTAFFVMLDLSSQMDADRHYVWGYGDCDWTNVCFGLKVGYEF